jgi:GNAT superfamily N-acetyltransferase
MFEWEALAALARVDTSVLLAGVAICSRVAVEPLARRAGVFSRLLRLAETLAAAEGLRWLVAVVAPSNRNAIASFRKHEWQDYGVGTSARGWQGLRMWKSLGTEGHR